MKKKRMTRWDGGNTRKHFPNRLLAVQFLCVALFGLVIVRLFQLQVVSGNDYFEKAIAQRSSHIELPARRGEIMTRDRNTGDLVKLATNTTLDLLYIDPKVTPDKRLVADTLAPLIYTDEDYADCMEEPKFCPQGSAKAVTPEAEDGEEAAEPRLLMPTKEEAVKAYADQIFQQINREKVDFVNLKAGVDDETLLKIEAMRFPGVGIVRERSLVYADPTKIPQDDKTQKDIAKTLSELLQMPEEDLLERFALKDLRYVRIKNKLRPEISEKINELKEISRTTYNRSRAEIVAKRIDKKPIPDYFRGVVLVSEHWRYYPDNNLAAQVIGFVNREGRGQYGIEGKYDRLLAGKNGVIESETDVDNYGISPTKIVPEENGADIVLTIDRVIQKRVEEVLSEATERFKADSGQVIVMEPATGRIVAMANAPVFNPNEYGDALSLRRTTPGDSKKIYKTMPVFVKDEHGRFQPSSFKDFTETWKQKFDPEFFVYRNRLGPGAFVNRTIQEVYEPGSVFKPLIMAVGIEAGEITPSTTYNEDGPVKIGQFTIRTALHKYNGIQTMTNVLETSSNVGMVFVAFKLGKSVMHDFITDRFGFGEFTDVTLADEEAGTILPKKDWSDAHLATASFGQGLTVTPLQIMRAWAALANGGMLVQPMIVEEEIFPDGRSEKYEPKQIRRVISPDTASALTTMLVSSVDQGVAAAGAVPGYKVAGKTGTSQIAGPDGKYEATDVSSEGAFITSFAGYAPANDPKYLVLVKFDRPRYGAGGSWGTTTAAPVFKEVMAFLLEYGNVQPTEEVKK